MMYLFTHTLQLLILLLHLVTLVDGQSAKCPLFESRRADLLRIQQLDHQRSTPFTPIMGNRKHTPVFTITGTEATVTVGTGTVTGDTSLVHPTDRNATHFVSTIYVVNQDNIIIAMNLLSGTTSQPSLTFQIPRETTSIQAFSFCNNHGLHGSEVSQVTATGTALAACAVIPCYEDTVGIENGVCVQFAVMEADAMRRQLSEHQQTSPFPPSANTALHTPYVTITGTSAKVTVGLGTTSGNAADPIHPSEPSEDPLVVHYIEMLFVKDQTGKIIAASYLPATKFPPTLEFLIPSGTTSLTAFSMCNTHGLFQSSIVSVPSSSQGSGSLVCGVAECGGAARRQQKCPLFESRRADLLRIQQLDHQRSTPFTPIMGNRKHTPVFTITGTEATVTVGTGTVTGDTSLVHPTDRNATHFVSTIYVVNQDNIIIAMNLLSGTTSQPSLTFQIPRETTSIQAFSFCNNHGLHGSEVSQVTATGTALAACAVIPCYEDTIGIENGVCVQFTVMEADAMRRQLSEHQQTSPFPPSANTALHTPYVTITGTSAKVTVGLGTTSGNAADPIHPSVSSEDPLVVHYIEMLFVKDQTGKIIAASYLPATKFPPTLEFLIPSGTTSLTAFSMCNTHGLFQSSIVSVPSSSQGSGSLVCGVTSCGGVEEFNCKVFVIQRSKLLQRQLSEHSENAAYNPNDTNVNHTPVLSISNGAGEVSVGSSSAMHSATNVNEVHFITHIYVVNSDDVIIAMTRLGSTSDVIPTLSFTLPEGISGEQTLTPYSFCSRFGLFRGQPVTVPAGSLRSEGSCSLTGCFANSTEYNNVTSSCDMFESLRTEYLRLAGSMSDNNNIVISANSTPSAIDVTMPSGTSLSDIESVFVVDVATDTIIGMEIYSTPPDSLNVATFPISSNVSQVHVGVFGLTSGLQKSASQTLSSLPISPFCSIISNCRSEFVKEDSAECYFQTVKNNFLRRQLAEHNTSTGQAPTEDNLKHTPFIEISGTTVTITVGKGTVSNVATDPIHSTVVSSDPSLVHFVENIYVEDQNNVIIAMTQLSGGGPDGLPRLVFDVPQGTTSIIAYAFCNQHGLFQSSSAAISSTTNVAFSCNSVKMSNCFPKSPDSCPEFKVQEAELLRRQQLDHQQSEPFTPTDANARHTPQITLLSNRRGVVTVGIGTLTNNVSLAHPTDPSSSHFISSIYVKDQTGTVLGFGKWFGEEPAILTFAIPPESTEVTAFSFCTLHGLYQSATSTVGDGNCRVQGCESDVPIPMVTATPQPSTPQPPTSCTSSDVTNYDCMITTTISGISVHWRWDGTSPTIDIAVRSELTGWFGISFPTRAGLMVPAKGIISSERGTKILPYNIVAQSVGGVREDANVATELGITTFVSENIGGNQFIKFTRNSATFAAAVNINVARDGTVEQLAQHPFDGMASFSLNFASGETVSQSSGIEVYRTAHGALMVAAWCYLLPFGILIKRYGKPVFGLGNSIRRGMTGIAFRLHIAFMMSGVFCTIAAIVIAILKFRDNNEKDTGEHNLLGLVIFILMSVQPIMGVIGSLLFPTARSRGRRYFSFTHKLVGRIAVVLAFYQVFTGIQKLSTTDSSVSDSLQIASIIGITFNLSAAIFLEALQRNYLVTGRQRLARLINLTEGKIGWAEIEKHCDADDPWVVIEGRVFAVKDWLNSHPGGAEIVLLSAGKDATDTFLAFKHSVTARQKLDTFYIGEVEDDRMVSAISLTEDIATSLVTLDLVQANKQIELSADLVPFTLLDALNNLLENLSSYKPFLPPSLIDGTFAVENEEETYVFTAVEKRFHDKPPENVAMVFTDIQSSTLLWEFSSTGMKVGLEKHNAVIREVIALTEGYEIKTIGDAFMVAFETPQAAMDFAIGVQLALKEAEWPPSLLDAPLCKEIRDDRGQVLWKGPRVRIGMHYGPVDAQLNPITGRLDFFGSTVNKSARVEELCAGGAVAVTEEIMACLTQAQKESLVTNPLGKIPLRGIATLSHITIVIPQEVAERKPEVVTYLTTRQQKDTPAARGMESIASQSHFTSVLSPTLRAKKLPFMSHVISCAAVKINYRYLKQGLDVPDSVGHLFSILLENIAKTEGVTQSVMGGMILIAWGMSGKRQQHVIQSTRFGVAIHSAGWGQVGPFESWGGMLKIGLSTGRVVHGKVGTDTQRNILAIGAPVETAIATVIFAQDIGAMVLSGSIPGHSGITDDPTAANHIRLIDIWNIGDDEVVLINELNCVTMSNCRDSWGFNTDHPVDTTWGTPFNKIVHEALRGDNHAAEKAKNILAKVKTERKCGECLEMISVLKCVDCNHNSCVGCATGCTTHKVMQLENGPAATITFLTNHLTDLIDGKKSLRNFEVGLDIRERPNVDWLGSGSPLTRRFQAAGGTSSVNPATLRSPEIDIFAPVTPFSSESHNLTSPNQRKYLVETM